MAEIVSTIVFAACFLMFFCGGDLNRAWNNWLVYRSHGHTDRIKKLEAENKELRGDVKKRLRVLEDVITDDDAELNQRLLKLSKDIDRG